MGSKGRSGRCKEQKNQSRLLEIKPRPDRTTVAVDGVNLQSMTLDMINDPHSLILKRSFGLGNVS